MFVCAKCSKIAFHSVAYVSSAFVKLFLSSRINDTIATRMHFFSDSIRISDSKFYRFTEKKQQQHLHHELNHVENCLSDFVCSCRQQETKPKPIGVNSRCKKYEIENGFLLLIFCHGKYIYVNTIVICGPNSDISHHYYMFNNNSR